MGAALSHSLHHSRRPAQVQQCARLMSICGQQPQESSKCVLASVHASTYFQHPFCTEIASGISSSTDRIRKQQLQKEQCQEWVTWDLVVTQDYPPKGLQIERRVFGSLSCRC
ncbi:hypothetical protein WJX82_005203 [Trebouxia sp. C0006]